ncbi:PAS domain-containing protein [Deltaproteobacteria bacterium TL4]
MLSRVSIKNSITFQLLSVVFTVYVVVTLTLTALHMIAEYNSSKSLIRKDMQASAKTFERALSHALWTTDVPQIKALVKGIHRIPFIVGVLVTTDSSEQYAVGTTEALPHSKTQPPSTQPSPITTTPPEIASNLHTELFYHTLELFQEQAGEVYYVGSLTLFSSTYIVWQRIRYGFLFIIVNAIIKTIALWLIFLIVGRTRLSLPLTNLANATMRLHFDRLETISINLKSEHPNELNILEDAFNEMIMKLKTAREQLHQYSATLRKTNTELSESERTLATLMGNLPGMAFRCVNDNQWTMEFVSEGCIALTEYLPEDLIQNKTISYEKIIYREDRKMFYKEMQSAISSKAKFMLEHRINTRSNKVKWISAQGIGLYSTEGSLLAIEGLLTDITNRKQTEEELQQHKEHLEELIQERTRELEDTLVIQQSISDNLLGTSHELKESRQQLEQQFAELQASYSKLSDLDNTKNQLLKKMNNLNETRFPSLKKNLNTLAEQELGDAKIWVQQAVRDADAINEALRPFQSLYLSEQAIQSKRLLLAEANKKEQVIAKLALGGTGVDLHIVSDIAEGLRLLNQEPFDIICVNSETIELAQYADEHFPEIKTMFITSQDARVYLPLLQKHAFLSNIVSRNDEDRTFTLKNISITVSKLITGDLFGLEKYLHWGVDVQQHAVTHSGEREKLINQMESDMSKLGVRRGVVSRITMVAEELLMNAIYDAPHDAKGIPLYNHLSRVEEVVLKPEEQGVLRYACDGLLIAVSVEDPFGAFHRNTILDYLDSCYGGRQGSLQQNKGGAGRGIYQIIETADLVVFNVKPKVRTEVIAIFNIEPNASKSSKPTSFHYFYDNPRDLFIESFRNDEI